MGLNSQLSSGRVIMIIAVGLSCLVAVAVLEGTNGFPDQHISVQLHSQIDEFNDLVRVDDLERNICRNKKKCNNDKGVCILKDDTCTGKFVGGTSSCNPKGKCRCCVQLSVTLNVLMENA